MHFQIGRAALSSSTLLGATASSCTSADHCCGQTGVHHGSTERRLHGSMAQGPLLLLLLRACILFFPSDTVASSSSFPARKPPRPPFDVVASSSSEVVAGGGGGERATVGDGVWSCGKEGKLRRRGGGGHRQWQSGEHGARWTMAEQGIWLDG
jgi:hypothetical protein